MFDINSIIGLGTIVNTLAVIAGAALGLLLKKALPKKHPRLEHFDYSSASAYLDMHEKQTMPTLSHRTASPFKITIVWI